MKVYAVVGGIGAGKSTVCRMLQKYGGAVVDADRLGHQALRQAQVERELLQCFGADIVGPDGRIDRRRLGRRVFGKPRKLRELNAIVHPEIGRLVRRRLRALARRKTRFVLLDAALYFEVDLGIEVDAVIAVTAPRAVRRRRLAERDGLSAAEIEARLTSQPQVGVWTRRADFKIDTRGSLETLGRRVDELWDALQNWSRVRETGGKGGKIHRNE